MPYLPTTASHDFCWEPNLEITAGCLNGRVWTYELANDHDEDFLFGHRSHSYLVMDFMETFGWNQVESEEILSPKFSFSPLIYQF